MVTFIKALAEELQAAVADLATVGTFHWFCALRARKRPPLGLKAGFTIYPALFAILEADLAARGVSPDADVEQLMQDLVDSEAVRSALEAGDYYNATAFTDLVYRVFRDWKTDSASIPSFSLVVVDEYQDFNRLEVELIELLMAKSAVLIAGDDDQALYGHLRRASPHYLRSLATRDDFELHQLPYSSRCTQVIVGAAAMVIRRATAAGALSGRVDKPFKCYLKDKLADSQRYPKIIRANCSVERNNAPYLGKYVAEQIAQIDPGDLEASVHGGWLAALVVGPIEFSQRVHAHLVANGYPDAKWRRSPAPAVTPLDGYRLAGAAESSRLGWRILAYLDGGAGLSAIVPGAMDGGLELEAEFPPDFVGEHATFVKMVRTLTDGLELAEDEWGQLTARVGMSRERILRRLGSPMESETEPPPPAPASGPSIMCTTLVGAKGLSAEHVFVVGVNERHFPRDNSNVADEEICQLIVALTRTRKACHVVSCRRFGQQTLQPSLFDEWLRPFFTATRQVDAAYWEGHAKPAEG